MAENVFTCQSCGEHFTVPQAALDKYPNWKPRICLGCKNADAGGGGQSSKSNQTPQKKSTGARGFRRGGSATKELNLPVAEILTRFSGGPQSGLFTDGACSGNPGPGGWGVVWVRDKEVLEHRHGHDPQTTNNRMELQALIVAYELLPTDTEEKIYTDSQLCVNIINTWAAGWERRGWRRKGGEIKNLELVQRAYTLAQAHPRVELNWIKAHDGSLWNEYADALATAYLRDTL
ncbi:MAG: ribonuclease HI [Deltaproteobacteria bacterium]|nr:ribonuclease HI [Deltaproteobacteria bacterium]